jgi:hypothetical protein
MGMAERRPARESAVSARTVGARPRTTWQARRRATDFEEGVDARTAWVMARLTRHPDERGYAMTHLDDERRTVR